MRSRRRPCGATSSTCSASGPSSSGARCTNGATSSSTSPEEKRPGVETILKEAFRAATSKTAKGRLEALAGRLAADYPSAAESLREGLDELFTVKELGVPEDLDRALSTTNAGGGEMLVLTDQARVAEDGTTSPSASRAHHSQSPQVAYDYDILLLAV